ncbi:baseplate J/gp47 family protein [Vibrio sp. OPT18]|uniref:baseplate J/gp47 family protein n=1 Tax=Vibrio sp. OPT18 TaxID=2778641 RepID=UPI0018828609|nr:baseplate J/gp47 family protein [Vibrio sp. OPT18]MBE8578703.1 baseplate J/gp47 family protein [Vibrio sp. OPT18]
MKTPLGQLPMPTLIDSDYQETLSRVRQNYQTATKHYPSTSDPETFQLEQMAYEREMLVDEINHEGQQNLIAFAKGAKLDNLGALVDCERLDPTSASSDFLFTFKPEHRGFSVPKGFSVLARDGKTIFITLEEHVIAPGTLTQSLILYAQHVGPEANGFMAGEIAQISKPMTEIVSAVNVTISVGGSYKESDESYSERIYLAPSGFSSAGPYDAYEYFARSAHPGIARVKVLSPEPNHIDIYVRMRDDSIPSKAILDTVEAYCSAQKRRPIGDLVKAKAAEPYHVNTTMNLQIYSNMQSMATSTVSAARSKIDALTGSWQMQLGRDVVPESLTSEAQVMQAVYLATTPLEFKAIAQYQYPVITVSDITYDIVDEQVE